MTPEQQRAVIAEAETWLRTPYHHCAAVKGVGVDCLMLLCASFHAAGVTPAIDPRPYPTDWMLHHSEERYLDGLLQHALQVPETAPAEPGDIQLFRFGRTFSHAAIVTDWPHIIHAYLPARMVVRDRADAEQFKGRLGPRFRVQGDAA